MASFHTFAGGGRPVSVEMAAGTGSGAVGLAEIFATVTEVVAAYSAALDRVPDKKKPSESKVAFGLSALEDGSIGVTLDTGRANFTVTLTWSSSASAGAL